MNKEYPKMIYGPEKQQKIVESLGQEKDVLANWGLKIESESLTLKEELEDQDAENLTEDVVEKQDHVADEPKKKASKKKTSKKAK